MPPLLVDSISFSIGFTIIFGDVDGAGAVEIDGSKMIGVFVLAVGEDVDVGDNACNLLSRVRGIQTKSIEFLVIWYDIFIFGKSGQN